MKRLFTLMAVLAAASCFAQDTVRNELPAMCASAGNVRHKIIATVAVGFIDNYRTSYSLPAGFEKSNTTGFAPVYGKLEYGLTPKITIAAIMSYDAFVYNYNQLYDGHNGAIRRYRADRFRAFSGGIAGTYYFKPIGSGRPLQPFASIGVSLSNIRHSAYPQGDSTVVRKEHALSPYLKVGARYFITDKFGVYADAGYDRQSFFSLGVSCYFSKKG
ncbi:MAG: hypothetical protein V4649_04140 [Bacteroidota bacterium]